jgi:dTDP-4-amino-4,6-dideoxy-D-galactose acyltransferase
MINFFTILNWDSDFFGYQVAAMHARDLGKKELEDLIVNMKKQDVELVYIFTDPNDSISTSSVQNFQAFLADEKVTFIKQLTQKPELNPSQFISPYKQTETSNKLRMLALQSGIYSRFKTDKGFCKGEYEKLYTEWINKSVNKKLADEVLVFYKDDDEKGFITLSIKGSKGSIGLVAVDELERGNSIGKELLNAAQHSFWEKGVSDVEVVTQKANSIACEFYKSFGFSIKNIENVYHLWIRK